MHQFCTHCSNVQITTFIQKYQLIIHTTIIVTDSFLMSFPQHNWILSYLNSFSSFQTDECQKSLKQFPMMVDENLIQSLPLDGGTQPFIIIIALVLSLVVIMLVAMLGWVLYAYRNPTTRSGQILIRSTAKSRLFRSPSTSTV